MGFQLLGQISARDLMTQHDVAAAMGDVGVYLQKDGRLKTLLNDAGIEDKSPK